MKPEDRKKNRSFAANDAEYRKMKIAAGPDAFGNWARKTLMEAARIAELISPLASEKARVKEERYRQMTELCPKCGKETYCGLRPEERWCKAFSGCGWKGSVGETIRPGVV